MCISIHPYSQFNSTGSRDILKAALASDINPPLSVTFANKYATISTNSLQQWFSSHPVTSKDSVFNLSESTEVLKRKRLIVTPPVASQQLMNAQKEAVCQEFVSNMKHYSKTKFKEKVCVYSVKEPLVCSGVLFGGLSDMRGDHENTKHEEEEKLKQKSL